MRHATVVDDARIEDTTPAGSGREVTSHGAGRGSGEEGAMAESPAKRGGAEGFKIRKVSRGQCGILRGLFFGEELIAPER
jgi:hypothetical protein